MTDEQAHAYIAGLIDGEGCISINRHKNGIGIQVAINMTNSSAIAFVQARYGGSMILVNRSKNGELNRKPVFQWRVEARKAERLLRDIWPYLLVKREQCELALSVRDHLRNGGVMSRGKDYRPGSDKDLAIGAFREAAKARMHELNKRGIN